MSWWLPWAIGCIPIVGLTLATIIVGTRAQRSQKQLLDKVYQDTAGPDAGPFPRRHRGSWAFGGDSGGPSFDGGGGDGGGGGD